MRGQKAERWIEGYLYRAREHRALEESVFAEGERQGYSERRLRRAADRIGVNQTAGCWQLPLVRAEALDARSILALGQVAPPRTPVRRGLPAVHMLDSDTRVRARRAA